MSLSLRAPPRLKLITKELLEFFWWIQPNAPWGGVGEPETAPMRPQAERHIKGDGPWKPGACACCANNPPPKDKDGRIMAAFTRQEQSDHNPTRCDATKYAALCTPPRIYSRILEIDQSRLAHLGGTISS